MGMFRDVAKLKKFQTPPKKLKKKNLIIIGLKKIVRGWVGGLNCIHIFFMSGFFELCKAPIRTSIICYMNGVYKG